MSLLLLCFVLLVSFTVHAEDLGELSANPYNPNSIANPFGAGNPFNPNSVTNPFGVYGNPYSNRSATNPFATEAPAGRLSGYFSKEMGTISGTVAELVQTSQQTAVDNSPQKLAFSQA